MQQNSLGAYEKEPARTQRWSMNHNPYRLRLAALCLSWSWCTPRHEKALWKDTEKHMDNMPLYLGSHFFICLTKNNLVMFFKGNTSQLTFMSFSIRNVDESIHNLTHLLDLWNHTVAAPLLVISFVLDTEHLINCTGMLFSCSVSLLPKKKVKVESQMMLHRLHPPITKCSSSDISIRPPR